MSAAANSQVTACFVDETGALHGTDQPLFGVGLLVVRQIGPLTDVLHTATMNLSAQLRQKRLQLQRDIRELQDGEMMLKDFQLLLARTRHHEYKFTGIRHDNIHDYLALLNLFFSFPGSEFHAVILERSEVNMEAFGGANWVAYVTATRALLARRLNEPSFVHCDWQSRPRKIELSLEEELRRLPFVSGCLRVRSESSPFVQLVDLFLGVVSFDWREDRGLIVDSAGADLKRDVVHFVKKKLGMAAGARFLPGRGTYSVRHGPLKFSVWQPNSIVPIKGKSPGHATGSILHSGMTGPGTGRALQIQGTG